MITTRYIRRQDDDPHASTLLERLRKEGFFELQDLLIEKAVRLEGIDSKQADRLRSLFCHPFAEIMTSESTLNASRGPILEVGYQRAVTDPELPSILRASQALGVKTLSWVRLCNRYQFIGASREQAVEMVSRHLYNPQVQVLIEPGETWDTLKPRGSSAPLEHISLLNRSPESLLKLSEERRLFLDREQMTALQNLEGRIGRPFTDAELEMFAQTWSDHCFHTTWKSLGLLQALWEATHAIDHPMVLSVFEDNAGAVDFYDGWALTVKGETHNSPTAVSPYGGIMTKHGGVIRDTLGCGQGAKPIGGSTVMGLGDPFMPWEEVPRGALHPRTILMDAIRGTADYTNPMGIPMMFPVYQFHSGYTGKCFALGHSIGLIPRDRAQKGRPRSGDLVVLIGGLTGRDGLHGATVSSSSMTSETAVVDAAHVQIGHPIEERKFMEAIPVLRDADCLRAVTDLGAGGLSSAAGEMGAETGVWIDLARVPLKTEGLRSWEIWISESQERMLLCVPREKWDEASRILERFEVTASLIGRFTGTNRCQVVYDDEHVVDLPFEELRRGCPLPSLEPKAPQPQKKKMQIPDLNTPAEWEQAALEVIAHLNVCDQSRAGMQFDSTVQGCTVTGPYGGVDGRMPEDVWISTPIHGKPYGAVSALAFNPIYAETDPVAMASLMMVESITKCVAAGVDPKEIVLCDNFYTPRVNSKIAWILKHMVLSCCELSRALGTPFISGKDSSSGTFIGENGRRIDIPPTLAVLSLGRIRNVRKRIPKPWQQADNVLILAGPVWSGLDGSIYLDTLGQRGDRLPPADAGLLNDFWKKYSHLAAKGRIRSASALAQGGLFRRLFEMALGSGLGCRVDLEFLNDHLEADSVQSGLFAEMIGCVLLETDPESAEEVQQSLGGCTAGRITNSPDIELRIPGGLASLKMDTLIQAWEKPFQEIAR
ncbi:MAG TPA: hypothetical protein ENN03_02700 [bacterium]|nr:hypothetical protein [bacterium]